MQIAKKNGGGVRLQRTSETGPSVADQEALEADAEARARR